MKKIIVIGGGAMGSAFTVPCLDNNNKVIITLFLFSKHGTVNADPIAPPPITKILFIINY